MKTNDISILNHCFFSRIMLDPSNRIIIKFFLKFLMEEDAYEKYSINLYSKERIGDDSYMNSRCESCLNLINSAFSWALTPEKHGFWSQINSKWGKVYDEFVYQLEKNDRRWI